MAKESSLRISARANMAGCLSQILTPFALLPEIVNGPPTLQNDITIT